MSGTDWGAVAAGRARVFPPHRHWIEPEKEVVQELRSAPLDMGIDDSEDIDALLPGGDPLQPLTARAHLQVWITSRMFQGTVALLIIINAVVIGLETDSKDTRAIAAGCTAYEVIENCLLLCFTLELTLRISAFGPGAFFSTQGHDFIWNSFDAGVVSIGIFDFVCDDLLRLAVGDSGVAMIFRLIRLMRILRIFRLIRFLKQLYILTYGFALASLAIFWVTILMTAGLYICAIILVRTYGRMSIEDPEHEFFQEHYGDVFTALFTLFQLMMQPNLMEYKPKLRERPILALFLVIFVIFGSFGMIALLTGVITEAMFEKNVLRLQEEQAEREASRRSISNMCAALFAEIETDEYGEASKEKLIEHLPRVEAMFNALNVHYVRNELMHMVELMDTDGSGAVNKTEFCRALIHIAERTEDLQPMLMMELQQDAITFVKNKVERLEKSVSHLEVLSHATLQAVQRIEARSQNDSQAYHGSSRPKTIQVSESDMGDSTSDHQGLLAELRGLVARVEQQMSVVQGDLFSMGSRLEEILSDSRSEQISSQLAELAVRRRCMEFESVVASRLSACEAASMKAKQSSDEVAGQVRALTQQVQILSEGLRRLT